MRKRERKEHRSVYTQMCLRIEFLNPMQYRESFSTPSFRAVPCGLRPHETNDRPIWTVYTCEDPSGPTPTRRGVEQMAATSRCLSLSLLCSAAVQLFVSWIRGQQHIDTRQGKSLFCYGVLLSAVTSPRHSERLSSASWPIPP
jgi:hypothetical protein